MGAAGLRPNAIYLSIGSNRVERLPADTVVLITANSPDRELADTLAAEGRNVRFVGDAASPCYLGVATREGWMAGASV